MTSISGEHKPGPEFDIDILRPEMKINDIQKRGEGLNSKSFKSLRKALKTLHTLEIMAVNIYKFQISKKQKDLDVDLIAAMCNEMTHFQDFQIKLYEYGISPGKWRFAYWIVGMVIGFISKLLGKRSVLKTGIWVERKAVRHYERILRSYPWNSEIRQIILKDQADERGHIDRWKQLLSA